ncbi:MAG: saccharopine dehydrogenase NADP-binding domain-containing protein [Chloroflexi bacterium]|nr:saccharopine dehydrogenase NADP-binding domain-containing protein [Chloroflexota bacterium]
MKRVLILGAGLVTGPMVHYLLDKGYHVTVASRTVSKAEALIGDHPNGAAIAYDIEADADGSGLIRLVSQADLAVSMLPYIHHPAVAKACIAQGKHMVTTSYVSPAMRELDAAAKEAGITILNEVGVDPGIDHMSAMQIIHKVQKAGGHIDGFMSYCGGLPAPEANDNPFGYKFSWSPRGVLLAARNAAHYLRDGQDVSVPGQELFTHYWQLDVEGLGQFEAYPNRDSLPYREVYGISDTATMYRGTLRNQGWCDVLYKIAALGFLDDRPRDVSGKTYAQFVRDLLPDEVTQTGNVKADTATSLKVDQESAVIKNLAWLGFFDEKPISAPKGKISPLDLMTQVMLERMQYAEGERDLIILVHHFDASYPDGKKEKISSTLIAFGEPGGDTAMARTVSLPAAIGVDLILRSEVAATGIQTPVTPMWYEPILAGLKELGIECVERVETVA